MQLAIRRRVQQHEARATRALANVQMRRGGGGGTLMSDGRLFGTVFHLRILKNARSVLQGNHHKMGKKVNSSVQYALHSRL